MLDEVAVYDYALTPTQIAQHYSLATATNDSGTVHITVSANGNSNAQTATLTIAGHTVTLTQAGQP